MKITLEHARHPKANYCTKGIRLWFKAYGLDYNDFRKNGIDEEVLLEIGDKQGVTLVEIAHGQ